jgi:hypothetical protein
VVQVTLIEHYLDPISLGGLDRVVGLEFSGQYGLVTLIDGIG